jgi:hypothetical protein
MRGANELSAGGGPSIDDSRLVDLAVSSFRAAAEPEAQSLFEGQMTDLAVAIAERYTMTSDGRWLTELAKLSSATAMVEAENISAIADSFLHEKGGLTNLWVSRNLTLKNYVPEPDIFDKVDLGGARIVATADRYEINWKGNPIFFGTVELLGPDGTTASTFEFATGSGSQSHRTTNGPCPPGRYSASAFRPRTELGFVVGKVGYSINLDERDGTEVYGRKYFRIHPDGGAIGTSGCIGIRGDDMAQMRALTAFETMLNQVAGHSVIVAICYKST